MSSRADHWLARASILRADLELLSRLLDAGLNPNATTDGMPLLHAAIDNRIASAVHMLVEHGADVERRDSHGRTALMAACERKDAQIVALLLSKGADVDAIDGLGYTALSSAILSGRAILVRLLLAHGATVDDGRVSGEASLRQALDCGSVDVVPLLLDRGADMFASAPDPSCTCALCKRHARVWLAAAGRDL